MENEELIKLVTEKANKWLTPAYDAETQAEVKRMLENEDKTDLIECFYKDLEFGTGGLRGIMGVGSNRMNKFLYVSVMTAVTTAACSLKSLQTFSLQTVSRFTCSTICVRLRKCHSLSVTSVARAVSS